MTERAFFARGTRLYPIEKTGPFAPLEDANASEGPKLLDAGWLVQTVVQSGQGALVVLAKPARVSAMRDRLFYVHGATAAPVEAPPADPETHRPAYEAYAAWLAEGGRHVAGVALGTGALVVVRGKSVVKKVRRKR